MPETSSPFSSFLKWIGGILATVISGLLLFWGQQRLWPPTPQPKPAPDQRGAKQVKTKQPQHIFTIDGRVLDTFGAKVIENAWVRLDILSTSEKQQADSEGRYAFSVEGFDPGLAGSISIDAPGYEQLRINLSLSDLSRQKEQRLKPEKDRFGRVVAPGGAEADKAIGSIAGGGKGAAIGALVGAGNQPKPQYVIRPELRKLVAPP